MQPLHYFPRSWKFMYDKDESSDSITATQLSISKSFINLRSLSVTFCLDTQTLLCQDLNPQSLSRLLKRSLILLFFSGMSHMIILYLPSQASFLPRKSLPSSLSFKIVFPCSSISCSISPFLLSLLIACANEDCFALEGKLSIDLIWPEYEKASRPSTIPSKDRRTQ